MQTATISDEQDAQIADVCPGKGLVLEPDGREDHALWGPVIETRVGYATDTTLRQNASSGGALSAILVHLLETGQVDRVLQTTAASDLPAGNVTVTSTTSEEVFSAAGSRYAPSAPLAGLEKWLSGSDRIAFVGKPCDVAALRHLARTDPRVSARFPVLLTFFCAGVPSLSGANKIITQMGVDLDDVAAFRYRGDGWPGFAKATLKDDTTRRMSYADSWGGILSKHVQFRCKICPDGTGGFADIACADAWETDAEGYPVFEERAGESLILSRTKVGEEIISSAIALGQIRAITRDVSVIDAMQPGQVKKRQLTLPRLLALRLTGQTVPKYRGFHLFQNSREAGFRLVLKNFLGTLRRILKGRLESP